MLLDPPLNRGDVRGCGIDTACQPRVLAGSFARRPLTLWSGFGGSRGGTAHFAHLGGYAGAFLYLRWLDRSRTAFRRRATAAPSAAERRVEGWRSVDLASVHEVNRAEVDRILGVVAETADSSFNPILELGFADSIRREWVWRRSRGESTANLEAFRHLDPGS